jgi:hypothetical protein
LSELVFKKNKQAITMSQIKQSEPFLPDAWRRAASRIAKFTALCSMIGIWFSVVPKAQMQEPFPPVSQEELQITGEPKAPGAPAILLYRQVDRNDEARTEYNYCRLKILTEGGRKYADVQIPFAKQLMEIRAIRARTIQPDGTITGFNGKIYEKTIIKAKGLEVLAMAFSLPDVRVNTIIDYSFESHWEYGVHDSIWILSADLFTRKAIFSLKPNPGFGLRWNCPIGLPAGTTPPVKIENKEVRMEAQSVPAFQIEDYMPPERALKFRVEFIYSMGNPVMDVAKFWQNYGKAWYQQFDAFVKDQKDFKKAVAQIVSAGDSPETKLRKIYSRVRQIRNTSFDRERNTQERQRDDLMNPSTAKDIWKRGYGGDVEINWLFIALARAAGFEADSVYISTRDRGFFELQTLNASQLNAIVALVKLDGKYLYLNPGAKLAPFGLLPWHQTHVKGMRLDSNGGQWVETSQLSSNAATTERKAELVLSEDGTLEGKLTIAFGDLDSLELRASGWNADDANRKTLLEHVAKTMVPASVEVELSGAPDWTGAGATLTAEYRLKIQNWASAAGGRIFLPLGLFSASEKKLFVHANRIHPIYFSYPYKISDSITIRFPSGWKVSSTVHPIDQDAETLAYSLKAEGESGLLHINRSLRVDLEMVPTSQYERLRRFFQIVRTLDEQQVVLQTSD